MNKLPDKAFVPDPRQPLPSHAKPGDKARPATTPQRDHPISGTPNVRACPSCNRWMPAEARRCGGCGEASAPISVKSIDFEGIARTTMRECQRATSDLLAWKARWQAEEPLRRAALAQESAEHRQRLFQEHDAKLRKLGYRLPDDADVLRKDEPDEPPRFLM